MILHIEKPKERTKKKKRKRKPSRVAGYKIYMLKINTWKLKRCNNEHDLKGLIGHFFTL